MGNNEMKDLYGLEVPKWLRLLGCFGVDKNKWYDTYRFHWGEMSTQWGFCFSYKAGNYDAETRPRVMFNFIFGWCFIYMPWKHEDNTTNSCEGAEWGLNYYFGDGPHSINFYWNKGSWSWDLPWSWTHVRHDILSEYETPSYTYTLESGEVQHRTAQIRIEEREWRWKWFKFLPWPKMVHTDIDIEFSGEVGERTGGWKGGTTGCSYRIKEGETPLQTLRRMEKERKF